MKKMMVLLSLAVLLVLVCGCTLPAPAQPAATPLPTVPPAKVETPSPAPTTAVQTPISQISVSDNTVHIKKSAFDPANSTISVGSTVRWVNEDAVPHRILFVDKADSGVLSSQQSYSRKFDLAGTYNYSCTIHPSMQGTVIVE